MFSFFKKNNKDIKLLAPVTGQVIALENVPDKVFASKIMGDGVAFKFDGDTIFSPCDGKISMIAETSHAFGLELNNKAEILIHIGLDTVNLGGKGFTVLVSEGDKVKTGTPIIKIDRQVMTENNIDLTTPMVITNEHEFSILEVNRQVTCGESAVIEFK